jgi:hypothetical protein
MKLHKGVSLRGLLARGFATTPTCKNIMGFLKIEGSIDEFRLGNLCHGALMSRWLMFPELVTAEFVNAIPPVTFI